MAALAAAGRVARLGHAARSTAKALRRDHGGLRGDDRMARPSTGRLVDGLKQRGVLDNTLIVFLSDNGGNAEGGPAGRDATAPGPIGGPQSYVLLGHELGDAAEHAVPPLQAFHSRGRHQLAVHRSLARRHPGRAPRHAGKAAGAPDRHHGDRRRSRRRDVPVASSPAMPSCRCKV